MPGNHTIGVLSDTHGWLDPALERHFAGASLILHAGDVGDPAILDALATIAPVVAVRGNIDGGVLLDLPVETTAEIAGRRIALLHVAGTPAHPTEATRALLDREHPDVLVVGHSHIPVAGRVRGMLWLNPGAAGNQGFHDKRTAALLYLDADGGMRVGRIELGARGSWVGG